MDLVFASRTGKPLSDRKSPPTICPSSVRRRSASRVSAGMLCGICTARCFVSWAYPSPSRRLSWGTPIRGSHFPFIPT